MEESKEMQELQELFNSIKSLKVDDLTEKFEEMKNFYDININNLLNEINSENNKISPLSIMQNNLLKQNQAFSLIESNINFNNILRSYNDIKLESFLSLILRYYEKITGISFKYINESTLKIFFNFFKVSKKDGILNDCYIILSLKEGKYIVTESNPSNLNFEKLLEEFNLTNDFCLFLCRIVEAFLPLFKKLENNTNKNK